MHERGREKRDEYLFLQKKTFVFEKLGNSTLTLFYFAAAQKREGRKDQA